MDNNPAGHFSAGALFDFKNNHVYILGVTSDRFPKEVKLPGGTNKNANWESTEETLLREFAEETSYIPKKYRQVHEVKKNNGHVQVYYLIKQALGNLALDEPKTMTESDGDLITVRWWKLEEFSLKLFKDHHPGFMKAMEMLAEIEPDFSRALKDLAKSSSTFYVKNSELIDML